MEPMSKCLADDRRCAAISEPAHEQRSFMACYCRGLQPYGSHLPHSLLLETRLLCAPVASGAGAYPRGITAALAVLTGSINYLLYMAAVWFGKFERHYSRTTTAASVCVAVCACTYVNAAVRTRGGLTCCACE